MLVVILLLLITSTKQLKIDDEEGNILYDDHMESKEGELIEIDRRVNGIPRKIVWNVVGLFGRDVGD